MKVGRQRGFISWTKRADLVEFLRGNAMIHGEILCDLNGIDRTWLGIANGTDLEYLVGHLIQVLNDHAYVRN